MLVNEYFDFSLTKAGVKSRFNPGPSLGAHFKLDNDVSRLFPYINATIQDARFYDKPGYIQFLLDDFQCTLYPTDVIAAPFADQDQAHKFAKRLIDFLNDLNKRKDSLKPNHKKYKPISVLDIFKLLPQTNCRECGFLTCMAFAGALSQRETTPDQCPEFHKPIAENIVYPVFDKNGNLASTIEIDIDAEKRNLEQKKQKEYIEQLEKKVVEVTKKNKTVSDKKPIDVQTDLTDREMEVLRLVAEGATNTEISDILSISPHTVKSHVIHIFNKLGVNDRTQAAVWAAHHKLV